MSHIGSGAPPATMMDDQRMAKRTLIGDLDGTPSAHIPLPLCVPRSTTTTPLPYRVGVRVTA